MDLLLAFLSGVVVTVMIIFNGQLSAATGVYLSTVLIHLIGLITFMVMMLMKKEKISLKKQAPLLLYTGGVVGVFTVLFNVMTLSSVGAALLTALGLLGQMITSVILEKQGWLGSIKKEITGTKLLSILIVSIGIGVMML